MKHFFLIFIFLPLFLFSSLYKTTYSSCSEMNLHNTKIKNINNKVLIKCNSILKCLHLFVLNSSINIQYHYITQSIDNKNNFILNHVELLNTPPPII